MITSARQYEIHRSRATEVRSFIVAQRGTQVYTDAVYSKRSHSDGWRSPERRPVELE